MRESQRVDPIDSVDVIRHGDVHALPAPLPDRDPWKAEIRSRIARLANDCGCAMGGIFLAAALTVTVMYFVIKGGLGVRSGLVAISFVIAASGAGKLVGLAVARIRLLRLRRLLNARLAAGEGNHVQLH